MIADTIFYRGLVKTSFLFLGVMLLGGCSAEKVEEFAFKKTMEYQLTDDCGENKECIKDVKEQMTACMEESNWRKYLDNEDDEAALLEFVKIFFPCFKDANGNSYFNY